MDVASKSKIILESPFYRTTVHFFIKFRLMHLHGWELEACRNTGILEAVGKCADVTEDWSKAHGTGLKEKQVPKVM
jgi:hypothetical protein